MKRIASLLLSLGISLGNFQVQGFLRTQITFQSARVKSERCWDCYSLLYSITKPENPNEQPLSSLIEIDDYSLSPTDEDEIPLKENQRLVCLGDVHGDLQALKKSLEIAGVYDKGVWVGRDTILVQCGDVLDRGSEELACFSLLAKLSHQAIKDGGKVILLYGNHEALNVMGLFQYATDDSEYEKAVGNVIDEALDTPEWRAQYVGNQPARWASYEPNGLLAKSLLANLKVAVKVGRTVCVHAGLTDEHLKDYGGLQGMNKQAKDWITSDIVDVIYNNQGDYGNQLQPWVEAEARQTTYINTAPGFLGGGVGATSPIWMRDYSSPNDQPPRNKNAQSNIDNVLKILDCDRMVMGHTIQSKINCALGGKAWRIDVGMSRGVVSGTPECLEVILKDGVEIVSVLTSNRKVSSDERQIEELANLF